MKKTLFLLSSILMFGSYLMAESVPQHVMEERALRDWDDGLNRLKSSFSAERMMNPGMLSVLVFNMVQSYDFLCSAGKEDSFDDVFDLVEKYFIEFGAFTSDSRDAFMRATSLLVAASASDHPIQPKVTALMERLQKFAAEKEMVVLKRLLDKLMNIAIA